jgi:PAS domain S-box-containing protein
MSSEAAGHRRLELALLQELLACGAGAETLAEAAAQCAPSLCLNPRDLPFAAIYLFDPHEPRALQATTTHPGAGPVSIPLTPGDHWQLAAALELKAPIVVRLPQAPDPGPHEAPGPRHDTAAVVALVEPHGIDRLGVLVAGLNSGRPFDDDYRGWIRLVGAAVASVLSRARARQSQRERDAALRESERRFAWFMNYLPGLAWLKDAQGRYLFVNAAAARAFGRFREDILGRTDDEIFPPRTAAEFRRNDARALTGTGGVEVVETLEYDDGVHHSLVSKFPIHEADGETLIGGIAIDITQRIRFEAALRESEARFRSLADNAPVLIWMNGLEGCEFVNREYLRFLGCRWEEVRGLGWQQFIHPDDREEHVAAYERALRARQPFQAQLRMRRVDGQYRWLHMTGVPRLTSEGSFVGFVGCSSDITDLKRTQQSLLEADRRKDEFLATLAHELRNPLAPIRNALETMRLADASDSAAHAQARGIMERQLQQMVRLIDDLLDIGRISRGKLELRKEPLLLDDVLSSALETMRPTLEKSGRELTLEKPDAPVQLEGDLTRLAQVVANLLHNAIKYTDPGGHIRLHARLDGAWLILCVADDGIGISPEALPRVFDMFTQVDGVSGGSRGGLGVGLHLVRTIVEMHGGSVRAMSAGPGRGAEFVIGLPAVEASHAVQPAVQPAAQQQLPADRDSDSSPGIEPADRPAPRRILVVDDNRDAATSLALMLEMKGNDVRTAEDGREALGVAETFRPDLIFLDIGLPGLDGYGVCRRIREQPWGQELPIVALTGWSQEEDRRRSRQSGFTDHLVKPAEPAHLDRLLAGLPTASPLR